MIETRPVSVPFTVRTIAIGIAAMPRKGMIACRARAKSQTATAIRASAATGRPVTARPRKRPAAAMRDAFSIAVPRNEGVQRCRQHEDDERLRLQLRRHDKRRPIEENEGHCDTAAPPVREPSRSEAAQRRGDAQHRDLQIANGVDASAHPSQRYDRPEVGRT